MQKILLPFFALALFAACQKEDPDTVIFTEKTYADVDPELWPFYQEFEEQAALRGLLVDLNEFGVTGVIEELNPDGVAGQCTYGSHVADVAIDQSFWENSNSVYFKEMVVFHELGHCFLHRGHEEAVLPNGTCASIMRSGVEDCRDNYGPQTRSAYLDELFSVVNP